MVSASLSRSVPIGVADCKDPFDFQEIAEGSWNTFEVGDAAA